jgi:putative polyhydroxyalkanoate system protein
MATIDIKRPHNLSLDVAKERAAELAKSMEAKLGIRWKWDGDNITFDAPSGMAKGATGRVTVATSSVRVEVDLPFLLRAVKGKVEQRVHEKLEALLG